jgi:hypothetical protein
MTRVRNVLCVGIAWRNRVMGKYLDKGGRINKTWRKLSREEEVHDFYSRLK